MTTEFLSLAATSRAYRRRSAWVKANLPSLPDPENAGRRIYSVASIEAYLNRLGEIEAEKVATAGEGVTRLAQLKTEKDAA